MKFSGIIVIFILVLISIFLIGCSKKTTTTKEATQAVPECQTNSDCSAVGKCDVASCVGGSCIVKTKTDCCGNGECEENENMCNCADDCSDDCVGDVEFITQYGNTQKSQYFEYGCVKTRCQIKYDIGSFDPRQAYHDVNMDNILIGMLVNYVQPFEVNKAKLSIELKLKDVTTDLIKMPIKISEIRVMSNSQVIGREVVDEQQFTNVGVTRKINVPISYSMSLPEESKNVQIQIDLTYMGLKKLPRPDGEGGYVRDKYGQTLYDYLNDKNDVTTMTQMLEKPIVFIDPDYDKAKVDFSQ